MSERAACAAYELIGAAALALAVPAAPWLWRRGLTEGLVQRLGSVPLPTNGFKRRPLWLHAASVGETRAALPLVESLRLRHPDLPWVVSNTTLTGRSVARREINPQVSTLLPLDPLRIVDRAFARVRPRALIVVENEIWPGMLRAADRVGASIVFVSARMSPRALRRYLWVKPLFRSALRRVDAFCAQTEDDAARLCELGAVAATVHVTGNLKAGRSAAAAVAAPPVELGGRPVLVAASTQPGEERFVLDACAPLWPRYPKLLLVLGPRRPERFSEVVELLERSGVPYQCRSASESTVHAETKVLLVDTLGELANFFASASAVFVGGTVAPIGGHNVLEPATAGVAVSFGPQLDNVRSSAQALLAGGGAVQVGAPAALAAHWGSLLADRDTARAMGRRAGTVAADLAGALPATLRIIEPLLRVDS